MIQRTVFSVGASDSFAGAGVGAELTDFGSAFELRCIIEP
jgi:hypothetical protein